MARKTAGKKADEAPAANDTAASLAGHPWWPDLDAGSVAKLQVYRVVYEDRKGLPGAGAASRVLLTPEPLPPAMLTGEGQVAATWGPGHYEVEPRDAANRFVKGGGVKALSIAGRDGRVPKFVREFEQEEEEDDVGASSEEVRLLKLKLSDERAARKSEREQFEALLRQQREAFAAQIADQRDAARSDRESLGGLFEQIAKASQMQREAPQSAALAAPDWMRERAERLESELREMRAKAHEAELAKLKAELAKRGGGHDAPATPSGEAGLLEQFTQALPLIKEGMEFVESIGEKRRAAAAEAAKVAQVRGAFKLGEHAVPRLEELRGARAEGKTFGPRLTAVFRQVFAQGMMPPAYVDELELHGLSFGGADDGDAAAEAAPSGADRAAVG